MATDRRRSGGVGWLLGVASIIGLCSTLRPAIAYADEAAPFAPSGFTPNGLTPNDTDIRLGDIGAFVEGAGGPTEDRAFTLSPSIGLQALATDNVYQVARPRQADLVTSILPELVLSGQSRRVQANIGYAPAIQLYAQTGRQDQIAQNFNGEALLAAVPDTLFLQVRGYGAQQSASGNDTRNLSPYQSSGNRTNTIALAVSPYATHRFGGDGDLRIGYTLNYSSQTGNTPAGAFLSGPSLFNSPRFSQFANATTRSNEEYATFTTGENFGRFTDTVRLDATQYSSTGGSVLTRAHRATAIDDFGYGVNRSVALLGSLGYEDIAYSGQPPLGIRDLVWSGGVRLTPNELSVLSVRYGHKDGFNAVAFNASYAVTARLRVVVDYSEGLTSSQEELADNLNTTTVDQYGRTISTATGAPSLVADQLLGLQNTLYRLKRLSAAAVSLYDRDTFALTVEQETRVLAASGANGAGVSDRGISGSFNWSRALTPDLTGTATLRYSHTSTQTNPAFSSDDVGVFLQASYAFSASLTGTLAYLVTNQSSNEGRLAPAATRSGQSFLQNAVILGLRKSL